MSGHAPHARRKPTKRCLCIRVYEYAAPSHVERNPLCPVHRPKTLADKRKLLAIIISASMLAKGQTHD